MNRKSIRLSSTLSKRPDFFYLFILIFFRREVLNIEGDTKHIHSTPHDVCRPWGVLEMQQFKIMYHHELPLKARDHFAAVCVAFLFIF